jgi:hypothetical protein
MNACKDPQGGNRPTAGGLARRPAAPLRSFPCGVYERPQEALGQVVPAAVYTPSPRPYPARLEDPPYASDFELRRFRSNGEIKWQGELIFIAQPLVGEVIGLHER